MRRSTVPSLPLQLVFPAVTFIKNFVRHFNKHPTANLTIFLRWIFSVFFWAEIQWKRIDFIWKWNPIFVKAVSSLTFLPRNPFWRGRHSTIDLLAETSLDQELFIENIFFLFAKQTTPFKINTQPQTWQFFCDEYFRCFFERKFNDKESTLFENGIKFLPKLFHLSHFYQGTLSEEEGTVQLTSFQRQV